MSRSVTPARRSQSFDDDSDDDQEDIATTATRRSQHKRARLSTATSQTLSQRETGDDVYDGTEGREDAGISVQNDPRPILPDSYRRSPQASSSLHTDGAGDVDSRKHQPGSIVRVTLENFVTYSHAEFFPGPNLNMVIGPNGTGKSSLVCAICLGLGWETKHLGRAKDIGEFVKHGSEQAMIEIELAADPDRHVTNPIITAMISKKKSGSVEFSLDGKKSTAKAIKRLAESYSIQVDNLCQFLPQDRVVEFAALSPRDLLIQTQRAAAPEAMQTMHQQLIEKGKTLNELETQHKSKEEALQRDVNRQRAQQADVDRWRERTDLQNRLTGLEKLRPFSEYIALRRTHSEAKARHREAHRELQRLNAQLEPNLRAVNHKTEYVKQIGGVLKVRKNMVTRHKRGIEMKKGELADCEKSLQDRQEERRREKEAIKAVVQAKTKHAQNMRKLRDDMLHEPAEVDFASINADLREKMRQLRDFDEQQRQVKESRQTLREQLNQKERQIEDKTKMKTHVQSQVGQQASKLQTFSPNAAKAWEWLQDNRDKFEGPVFGPPMIECKVKDKRHTAAIEAVIGQGELLAFTVTTRADFDLLGHWLHGKLSLNGVTVLRANTTLEQHQPPCSIDQLRRYGLQGWLIDLLDGPAEVLSTLCDSKGLHTVACTAGDLSSAQHDALKQSPITSWATDTLYSSVTRRREYGDKAVSVRVNSINQARYFIDTPVDRDREAHIDSELNDLKSQRSEVAAELEEVNTTLQRLINDKQHVRDQYESLTAVKNDKQRAKTAFEGLPVKLESEQTKYDEAERKLRQFNDSFYDFEAEMDKLHIRKAQLALDYAHNIEQLRSIILTALEVEMLEIEATSDLEQLKERDANERQQLQALKLKVDVLSKTKNELHAKGQILSDRCSEINAELEDHEHSILDEVREMSPDQLETEVQSVKARLEMNSGGNANIITEFERRAKIIEQRQREIAKMEEDLEKLRENIAKIRAKWEPELDAMIAEISESFAENFASIHCAGEVGIHKEDDFEQWAVEIRVKFRENEPLSVLNAQRQSGGERAVSTIFYLMAMQSLARAPFRVVDEINQGMDPRNERLVHSRLVQIACAATRQNGGGGSQYFLITPKLLNDLEYHENMKVHCIASGEWMPAEHSRLDFGELARKSLAVRMASA